MILSNDKSQELLRLRYFDSLSLLFYSVIKSFDSSVVAIYSVTIATMIIINKRFRVIDGWLVDIEKQEVISPSSVRSILTADEYRKVIGIENLKVFSDNEIKPHSYSS